MENRDKGAHSWLKGKLSSHPFRVYLALAAIILLSSVISIVNYTFKYEMIWDNDEGEFIYNSYLVSSGMKIYDFFYSFQKTPGIILVGVPVVSVFGNGFMSLFVARIITLVTKIFTIIVVFLIGKKLKNEYVGLFAALFFGIDSIINAEGGLFTPDIYTTFFASLSIYFYLNKPVISKFLAGLFLGLAFLFRPNSLVVALAIFTFEILNAGKFKAKFKNLFSAGLGFVSGILPLFLYLAYYGLLYKFFVSVWVYNLHYPVGNYSFPEIVENIFYHGVFKNAAAWVFGFVGLALFIRHKEAGRWVLIHFWAGFYLLSFFLWRSYTAGYLTDLIPPLVLIGGYGAYHVMIKRSFLSDVCNLARAKLSAAYRLVFVFFMLLVILALIVNFAIPFFDIDDLHSERISLLSAGFQENVSVVTSDLGMLFLFGVSEPDTYFYPGKERQIGYKNSGLENVYGEMKIEDFAAYLENNNVKLLIFNSLEIERFLDAEARRYIFENYEPVYYYRDSMHDRIKFGTRKFLRRYLLFSDTPDSSLDYLYFKRK